MYEIILYRYTMMSIQQEKPDAPSDYAGRSAKTEFEIRGKYLFDKLHYNEKNNTCKYDPNGVTFIQHPFNLKKLAVIEKPTLDSCNVCNMDHKTMYYKLEHNYSVCYCKNYREGNWVFKKTKFSM